MDADTVQALCNFIERIDHNKLLQLIETQSIEMYSQFSKNMSNVFNAYVLTQRPEDQRRLQMQHEKAQELAQVNTLVNSVKKEADEYPIKIQDQEASDIRVQNQIDGYKRETEALQEQIDREKEKHRQAYSQVQEQLAEAKANLAKTIEQMTQLQRESKQVANAQEQMDKEKQEMIKQLMQQEQHITKTEQQLLSELEEMNRDQKRQLEAQQQNQEQEIQSLQILKQKIQADIDQAESRNNKIREQIKDIQQRADDAFKATSTIRTDFDQECANYTQQLQELQDQIDAIPIIEKPQTEQEVNKTIQLIEKDRNFNLQMQIQEKQMSTQQIRRELEIKQEMLDELSKQVAENKNIILGLTMQLRQTTVPNEDELKQKISTIRSELLDQCEEEAAIKQLLKEQQSAVF